MLILKIGDIHITGKNPIARKDDLVEVQFKKIEEIIDIANEYDCPIISSGDIFNVPIIANSILSEFGVLLEYLKHPIYFAWGNHDLMYHSLELSERTSLGMLSYNNSKIKHISEFEDDYGIQWDYQDWGQPIVKCNSPLLLSHQAIANLKIARGDNSWIAKDKEFARIIEHDKSLHNYNLILCGHWHKKYNFKYKNTTVINAGPILRRTVLETDTPSITMIDLESFESESIDLKSARPFDECISDSHLEENRNKTRIDIMEFISALNSRKSLDYTSSFLDNLSLFLDNDYIDKPTERLLRELIAKTIENKQILEN